MRNKLPKITLAILGFALTLLLSCSDNSELEFPDEEKNSSSSIAKSSSSRLSSAVPLSSSAIVFSSSSSLPPGSSSSGCTAGSNTGTHYCSNGTMKQYGSVTDDGGRTYKTVEISYSEPYQTLLDNPPPQVWMAENLSYNASGSVCYDGLDINCDMYGRLYNWATAMKLSLDCNSENCAQQIDAKKHRGICPQNWHIPTKAEWNTLLSMTGGGTNIKATSGWGSFNGQDGNGTDAYGFAALPGGGGNLEGNFFGTGDTGYLWGNSGSGSGAYTLIVYHLNGNITNTLGSEALPRASFFSVRCIKD